MLRPSSRLGSILTLGLLGLAALSCARSGGADSTTAGSKPGAAVNTAAAAVSVPAAAPAPAQDPARLDLALRRAINWAATLDVHPVRLRTQQRMKGIKHFVELLDLLLLAHRRTTDPRLSADARERALQALAAVDEDAYHSLGTVDPQRFREDSMSYLRACWLAGQFGKDVARYRQEIDKVLPTIVQHLPARGVDQRMGFAVLFAQLGYPVPQSLERIYPETLIARR
jgi:hypothetical protein